MKKKTKETQNKGRHPPEINYREYRFGTKEFILTLAIKLGLNAAVAYLFYDSVFVWILLIPLAIYSLKGERKKQCEKRKKRLELEFKETILSVAANMQIGYSVENAFREAYREISLLYGEDSVMSVELRLLLRKVGNNIQIEDALSDIALRSGLSDIMDFSDIFSIAKRGGGDMKGIITNTASIIGDKQEVRREIETVVSAKKFENSIMKYMPYLIVLYISVSSKGYFDTMYHNLLGYAIMTAAFITIQVAGIWSDKVLNIKI